MPNIADMKYGFESSGVSAYLEEVRASSLETASEHAEDISKIKSALEDTWEGKSREKYLVNLAQDVKKFQDALLGLYNAFEKEVANTAVNMKEFDENLIK